MGESAAAWEISRSPEEIARILQDRARALAQPREEKAASGHLDLLAFGIGRERYAVDVLSVADVIRFVQPTLVPCTPPVFLGVVNHKGVIVPVLDLRRLFGTADGEDAAWRHIVTVEAGGTFLGIAADSLEGALRAEERLAPTPAASKGAGALIRGLTAETIAVLDVGALVQDPRIVVDEEVR